MSIPEPSKTGDILYVFLSLLLEGAPFILLGAVISGLIDAYLPSKAMDRLLPKNKYGAVLASGLLGAIFPVCECAIVPVIRRLVAKGLPVSCAISYMLSAPIINPIVAISTWSAFQGQHPWEMTFARLALGYAVAVGIGLITTKMLPQSMLLEKIYSTLPKDAEAVAKAAAQGQGGDRILKAMRSAQKDFVSVASYFVIGILLASIFKTHFIYKPNLQAVILSMSQSHFLSAPVLMFLAFLLSLCSTTDAFVIAAFSYFTLASRLAFLVSGPMMDIKLLFLYSTVFRPKFVAFLLGAIFVLTWLGSYAWQPFLTFGGK